MLARAFSLFAAAIAATLALGAAPTVVRAQQIDGQSPCAQFGTAAGTCAQGNDSRITGAAPTASPTFTGTVTLPGATIANASGITMGSGTTLNMNGAPIVSASSPLIFIPQCAAGGATWLIGPGTGYCSHALASATDNIGIGTVVFDSLTGNSTPGSGAGFGNVAIGSENMKDPTTGSNNTGIGFEAAHHVTTGEANTALGNSALDGETTGIDNTAVGAGALIDQAGATLNTVGVAIGRRTLRHFGTAATTRLKSVEAAGERRYDRLEQHRHQWGWGPRSTASPAATGMSGSVAARTWSADRVSRPT